MSDPLTWSPIRLGRWFGTTVRVHIFLILFVVIELLMALLAIKAEDGVRRLPQTACWLSLLLLALAIHELGHALAAYWLDCDQEDVHLWPLGNLVGPSARRPGRASISWWPWPGRSPAGPCFWASPSGSTCSPAPSSSGTRLATRPIRVRPGWPTARRAAPLTPVWLVGWFGYLNYVLFWPTSCRPCRSTAGGCSAPISPARRSVVCSRDNIYAPWTARATAAILFLTGLMRASG